MSNKVLTFCRLQVLVGSFRLKGNLFEKEKLIYLSLKYIRVLVITGLLAAFAAMETDIAGNTEGCFKLITSSQTGLGCGGLHRQNEAAFNGMIYF